MLQKINAVLLSAVLILATSCASIVSKSNYPINITSSPDGAKVSVVDRSGKSVYQGSTPAMVTLRAGSKFFAKERYQVTFEKDGFQTRTIPLEFKMDGWYWGNILIGGLLGMLIIDPATGAMWKPTTEILSETLSLQSVMRPGDLKIYTLDQVPNEWKSKLIKISN